MRQSIQALVARSEFQASGNSGAAAISGSKPDGRLVDGTYTELDVRSDELSFSGRMDLLTVAGQDVHITDYKSGEPSTEHEDQLRTYATLWARRSHPDPTSGRPLATRLTVSYVAHDVEVEPPDSDDIDRLARELHARVGDATAHLITTEPEARPTADTCRFCPVRHLCEDYWLTADRPLTAGMADLEIEVVARNGPRSWLVRTDNAIEGILRTSEGEELTEGQKRRLLGAFISPTEGDEPLTVSLSANSETYILREDD
jgi:hypothetical protein